VESKMHVCKKRIPAAQDAPENRVQAWYR